MPGQRSRAYKLQLSAEGVQLFLRCHCRLCRLVGDFLPYGTTLLVAVTAFDRVAIDDAVSLFLDPELVPMSGRIVRFVGTTPSMAATVDDIRKRIEGGAVHPSPQVWKIFVASLAWMDDLADREIAQLFEEIIHKS